MAQAIPGTPIPGTHDLITLTDLGYQEAAKLKDP